MRVLLGLRLGLLLVGLAAAVWADGPEASRRAFWTVPMVATIPSATDLLTPDAWPEAAAFTGLSGLVSGQLSRSQPVFYLGRDATGLLIGWRVPRLPGQPLRATAQRDGALWEDDTVEVFVDPGHTHSDVLQFMVNAAGTQDDARAKDLGWNAAWTAQAAQGEFAWAGVMHLPFATLGSAPPAPGTVWGFNVGVDRSPPQRPVAGWQVEETNLTWADLGQTGQFHEPSRLGHLIFRDGPPIRLLSLGSPWWRDLRLAGRGPAGDVRAAVQEVDGKGAWSGASAAESPDFELRAKALTPGEYRLAVTAAKAAYLPMRFRAAPALDHRLDALTLHQTLTVDCRLDMPELPEKTTVRAELQTVGRKVLRQAEFQLTHGVSQGPVSWSYAGLRPGRYLLVLRDLRDPELETTTAVQPPPLPGWLGSTAGKYGYDHVPRPWTALKVLNRDPLHIACWGREYGFARNGLFGTVKARGKRLLAAPVALMAETAQGPIVWQPATMRLTREARGAIEFKTEQAGGDLRLACQGRMEFDGFVKLRLKVSGRSAGAELRNLTLSIPFRREVARLLHHFPKPSVWVSVNMRKFNARAVPNEGWAAPFLYHVWVGDEQRGLQWLCETDELWRPADPERAIELIPEGDRMTLRLNLIGKPTRLDQPREYVFAFQASPVKPTPPDYRHWRYAQVGGYGMETAPYSPKGIERAVTYPAAGNFDPRQGTLEVTLVPKFNSTAEGEVNRSLFGVAWPADTAPEPERGMWFYWNQDDRGMRVVYREGNQYRLVHGGRFAWQPGEPHTVACTWGETSGIFVDGQQIAELPATPAFTGAVDLSAAVLKLGGADSDFVVRQIRISDLPRPATALGVGEAALLADEHTLLLDRFDDISGAGADRLSRPVRIASGGQGKLTEGVRVVADGLDLSRGDAFKGTLLDYFQELGLKTIGFHEHWSELQGFPRTMYGKELRAVLKAIHDRGMRAILYHSWQLSDTAPEYPLYLRECEVIEPNRFIYTREPKQKDYPICARSAWGDFLADGMQRLFREFGPDGIYSDGLSYPGECSNELHGCGYIGEDGKRHPTFSLFACREAMKRFAHILEQQGKPTLFVCHTSGAITLPTLAFADAYLDGEHLCGQPRPFRVPLDSFRAEFMGHNFGIPAYFLVYDWLRGMTTEEGLALSLLHDTEVPWSYEGMAPVYRAWDDFGADDARFEGYWQERPWLRSTPPGVEVSAYVRPDGEMMLVAVNVTEEPVRGTLALTERVESVRDARTGAAVPVADGAIQTEFRPWTLNLLRVKRETE